MPGVFISYRRDDSKGFGGALLRELNKRIGPELVFIDYEDIEGGTDFPAVLEEAVGSCDVLLALIGSRWLEARNEQGQRRLDDPRDFVRQEIDRALQRDIRVIPVLLDGAKMPAADQLPADLQALSTRNALELTNSHWDEDVARLTDHIREGLYATGVQHAASAKPPPDFSPMPPLGRLVKWVVTGFIGFGLLFGAIGLSLGVAELRFEKRAAWSGGEVVELVNDGAFYPVVRFVTPRGQTLLFRSGAGSSPPAYEVGARVRVMYDPARPEAAKIDSFGERWFLTLLSAGFGALFLLIGVAPLLVRAAGRWRLGRTLREGRPIVTTFHGVEEDTRITVQGRHPYRVVVEWRNPVSKELVHFRSQGVWEDPTELAKNRLITVVVDPNNFSRYVVDLSFLNKKPRRTSRDL